MATFGIAAIRTFAHGVAGLTDNDVAVEVRGTQAFTDGRTVVLPAGGLWEEGDFRALCGVACHEIAHVWFRAVLLVGAIGLSELECAHSMPGGIVFSVDPRDAGSSLHVAANRLRRLL